MLKRILSIFLFPALIFAQAPTVSVPTRAALTRALTIAEADSIGTTLQHQVNASARSWGYRETGSSGLIFAYYGGPAWNGSTYTSIADGTVTLTASATNYVERTIAGAVSANTSGWTAGRLPLYKVTTTGSVVTGIVDQRTDFSSASSAVSSVFGRTGVVTATSGDYGVAQITGAAPLASPTFTGTLTAPTITASTQFTGPGTGLTGTAASLTAGTATNATQLGGAAAASYALLASPAFTGTPTAPTASVGTNTTQIATTAFVLANTSSGSAPVNRLVNGSFYQGLAGWGTSGTTAPIWNSNSASAKSGSASGVANVTTATSLTKTGSIYQGFSVPTPSGTLTLNFKTAIYYTAAPGTASTGYVKVYLYDLTAATETLIGTYNLTASGTTPTFTAQSITVTSNITAAGDYGLRFELQAVMDNTGGVTTSRSTIVLVDEVKLVM